jgi:hypothetical protein
MTITITENEARAIYLALHRGAQREGEDILGLFLKTSGEQLLNDGQLVALLDKLEGNPNRDYPRYEMIFEGGSHYLPLWQAASWYDCGWIKVEIGQWVIDAFDPKSRRPLTAADRDTIREAADQHSEDK